MDGKELDAREFCYGRPYRGPVPAFVPIQQEGQRVPFTLAAFDMPVVEERVARTIESIAGKDVECYPVSVEGSSATYMIINVVSSLACVDETKSTIMKWGANDGRPDKVGRYRMITNLTIDPARVEGHDIFRIADWEVALIVSEQLRDAIEADDLGIVFDPVTK